MFKRISVILLLFLAVTACSTTNSALLYGSVDNTRLALVNENSSFDDLFAPRNLFIEPKGLDQVNENEVADLCGLDVRRKPRSFAATAASLLIEPAVRLFVDSVERGIRKEIEAYSAVYQATANTDLFYRKTGSERALNWTCFRFTRSTPSGVAGDPLKPEDVALDFIGQMTFSKDKGAIIVRPLRLFYARPKAAKGDRFGLAITLNAESTWLQGNVGSRSSIFEQTLLSERWVINEPKVKYYTDMNQSDYPLLPIPPWSTDLPPEAGGDVTLTMTVAEVGNAPRYLEKFAEVFSEKKNEIAESLNKALISALGF